MVVHAGCDKQESLMCGGLCAVVDHTPAVVRYLPTRPPAFDAADQRVAAKQIEIVSLQWQTDNESNVVYRMAPPPFQ